ncbi:hypothetical protein ACFQ4O_14640, partial [Methylopila musalis]
MSFSDQARAARAIGPQGEGQDADPRPIDRLAERLAQAPSPAPQTPPRRSLEQLVSMLSRRNIQTEDRLTNALEGFARWTEETPAAAPASASSPAPAAQPEPDARQPETLEIPDHAATTPEAPAAPVPAPSRATMTLRAALAEI